MEQQWFAWAVGIIIGLSGVFIGVILFVISNVSRSLDDVKESVASIEETVGKMAAGSTLGLPHLFLTALAREAKFWGKLSTQRADKVAIADEIASEYIHENDTIIVDSGTTVDLIPHILRERHRNSKVYTNNLLAAISVVPPVEGCDCYLLSGRVDPIYGATYNIEHIEEPVRPIRANQIILAATSISYDEGPMVDVRDHLNRRFKSELVRKALEDDGNPRLIVAVDWTKFGRHLDGSIGKEFNPVLEHATWKTVRSVQRFALVTTKPLDAVQTPSAQRAREEIDKFLAETKRGGMQIQICKV
jgi:hypothetical protein